MKINCLLIAALITIAFIVGMFAERYVLGNTVDIKSELAFDAGSMKGIDCFMSKVADNIGTVEDSILRHMLVKCIDDANISYRLEQ